MYTKENLHELRTLYREINDMQNEFVPFDRALELAKQYIETNARNYRELELHLFIAIKKVEAWLDR